MLTSKTVDNDPATGGVDSVSPTVLVTATSDAGHDTRPLASLSTGTVSHLTVKDDNFQEGMSEHMSASNTSADSSSTSNISNRELLASTETDKLEELGGIRIPVSQHNLEHHKRESFTFVPRPTSEDVVSMHGSFPDDNAPGPIADSPQQYPLPTEEVDSSQSYDQYDAYIHVRNRINNNDNIPVDTRREYSTGSDGDDKSRLHSAPANLIINTNRCKDNNNNSSSNNNSNDDDSNEEDDHNVNASTVFIPSPCSPNIIAMDDDTDVVDLVNVPRVHIDRTHIDRSFTNVSIIPEVEDILPGWQDAIRKAGTPNGMNTTTGTIKLPTSELVSTVYDVAADLNRRLSNWWHSHRLEGMPQDLTQIDQTINSTECNEPSNVKQSEQQPSSNTTTDTKNISKVTDTESTVSSSSTSYSTTYRHVWLLGKRYNVIEELPRDFRLDLYSRIWCTYRSEFENIGETAYTSDAGWGCMLRTGQSLFAQALLFHHIGRGKLRIY
jgi:hypothetical protein